MADLSRADLRGANLMQANLGSTRRPPGPKNERGAILKSVHFEGAVLKGADLTDADFTDAYLGSAYIQGVDYSKGKLIIGADLRDASLSGANLSGVTWDATTQWPERVKMQHAKNIPQLLKKQLGL